MRSSHEHFRARKHYRAPPRPCFFVAAQAGSMELVREAQAARAATRKPQLTDVLGIELRKFYAEALVAPLPPTLGFALDQLQQSLAKRS